MARYSEHARNLIDETVDLWKQRCLLSDGSLIFAERDGIWTLEHANDLYARFNKNPFVGADAGGTFWSKWEKQLEGSSPELRLFAAELLLVHFLFASSVTYSTKLDGVQRTLGNADIALPTDVVAIRALHQGIGHPGIGFNTRRDVQVAYLIDFARRIKEEPVAERERLLDDPWALRDFADNTEERVREMRHVLLHLLRPNEFERISSGSHKREIAAAFKALLDDDGPEDLDERLFKIRQRLEQNLPQGNTKTGDVDYYHPPLYGVWESTGGGDGDGASDIETLLWKKQIILYGPPGTSKTFQARQIAEAVIRRAALSKWTIRGYLDRQSELPDVVDDHIEWRQVHPGFGYEEFIWGLRLEGGDTRYVLGLLPRLIDKMNSQPDEERLPTVLVLDEINRTDLSRMFGEALSLIERDKRGTTATLPGADADAHQVSLTIPKDLYLIGTMNEIDQSVETIDFALRRRFIWRECPFERDTLLEIIEARWAQDVKPNSNASFSDADEQLTRLADRASELNAAIVKSPELGHQYQIGHTYFADITFFLGNWLAGRRASPPKGTFLWTANGRPQPPLDDLWARELRPLLTQYLFASDVQAEELGRLAELFKKA